MINNFSSGGSSGTTISTPSVPKSSGSGYYTSSGWVSDSGSDSSPITSSGGATVSRSSTPTISRGSAAPSVPTLASSQHNAPPLRLDANDTYQSLSGQTPGSPDATSALAALGNVPGQLYESPLSVANVLSGSSTRTTSVGSGPLTGVHFGKSSQGLIDQIEAGVGKIPLLGDLLGGAGDAVKNIQGIAPDIRNHSDIEYLSRFAKLPDDTPIWKLGGDVTYSLGGRFETLGQFRADMAKRNLTPDLANKNLADYPTSSFPLNDIGFRLAGDPTNALLPAGGPIKGVQSLLSGAGRGVASGIGLADHLVAGGKILPTAVDAFTSAKAIAEGNTAAVTLTGLGTFIGKGLAATADHVPSASAFFKGYTKLAVGTELATAGINWTTGELTKNPDIAHAVPALQGLHDLSQQILDNKPLSSNAAFSLIAAYSLPLHEIKAVIKKPISVVFDTAKGGGGAFNELASKITPEGLSFGDKKKWLTDRYGGQDGVKQLLNFIDNKLAYDDVIGHDIANPKKPGIADPLASVDEAGARTVQFQRGIADHAERMRADGRITNQMRVATYKEWFGRQAGIGSDYNITDKGGFNQPWDAHIAADSWAKYREVASPIGSTLIDRGDAAIGYQDMLYTEHLDQVRLLAQAAAGKTKSVPFKAFQQIVNRYPQLLINDTTDWFAQQLASKADVPFARFDGKLSSYKTLAAPLDTLTHETAAIERAAPQVDTTPTGSMTDQAVVEPNGNGPMTSQFADNVLGQGDPNRAPLETPAPPAAVPPKPLVRSKNPSETTRKLVDAPNGTFSAPGYVYRGLQQKYLGDIANHGVVPQAKFAPDQIGASGTYWAADARTALQYGDAIIRSNKDLAGLPDATQYTNPQFGVDEHIATRTVPASAIEYLGADNRWHPVSDLAPQGVLTAHSAPTIEDTSPIRVAHDTVALGPEIAAENVTRDAEAAAAISDETGLAWGSRNAIAAGKRADLAGLQDFVQSFPGYRLVNSPVLAHFLTDAPPAIADNVLRQTALWEWLKYSGPTAPLARGIEMLAAKPTPGTIQGNMRQAMYNALLPRGATVKQVDNYINAVSKETRRWEIRGYAVFRNAQAIVPYTLKGLAEGNAAAGIDGIFGKETVAAIQRDFHGWDRLVDQTHNRVFQAAARTADSSTAGIAKRSLAQLAENVYTGWQGSPVGAVNRMATKTLYPLMRFMSDPRWWLMNEYEVDLLGMGKYGMGSTRAGKDIPQTNASIVHDPAYGYNTAKQVADKAAERIVSGEDTGQAFGSRHVASIVNRTFDKSVRESIDATLNEINSKNPVFADLANRFGQNPSTWADQIYNTMYSLDGGVRTAIGSEAELAGLKGAEKQLAPFYDKLYEIHTQALKDMKTVLAGNAERTNLERLANHPLLYWPLSYQLKAAKWLFDVMTDKSFGNQTNFGGAYTLAHFEQQHKTEMATNPEYAKMFNDHPALWQLAQQILPITPWDLGVSLSRPVRYAGGWLGVWGAYKAAETPQGALTAIMNLGPLYTATLLGNVYGELTNKRTQQITVPLKAPSEAKTKH